MLRAPVRQWVLTVPHGLRFRMAFNPDVTGTVLRTFVSVVSRWLRRRARAVGIRGLLMTGGVTVIQRFGSALNLNIHFHTLMIDGVYEPAPRAGHRSSTWCRRLPDDEVAAIAGAVLRKVGEKVARLDAVAEDAGEAREPLPRGLAGARRWRASTRPVPGEARASGASAGRAGRARRPSWAAAAPCTDGFSFHANVRIAANDRDGAGARGALFGAPADRRRSADGAAGRQRGAAAQAAVVGRHRGAELHLACRAHREAAPAHSSTTQADVIRFHGVPLPLAAAARSGIVPQPKAAGAIEAHGATGNGVPPPMGKPAEAGLPRRCARLFEVPRPDADRGRGDGGDGCRTNPAPCRPRAPSANAHAGACAARTRSRRR